MKVRVNGQERELRSGSSLAELIEELGLDRRYLVVEYNGEPLAREQLADVVLRPGDRLELVRPVAGG